MLIDNFERLKCLWGEVFVDDAYQIKLRNRRCSRRKEGRSTHGQEQIVMFLAYHRSFPVFQDNTRSKREKVRAREREGGEEEEKTLFVQIPSASQGCRFHTKVTVSEIGGLHTYINNEHR